MSLVSIPNYDIPPALCGSVLLLAIRRRKSVETYNWTVIYTSPAHSSAPLLHEEGYYFRTANFWSAMRPCIPQCATTYTLPIAPFEQENGLDEL